MARTKATTPVKNPEIPTEAPPAASTVEGEALAAARAAGVSEGVTLGRLEALELCRMVAMRIETFAGTFSPIGVVEAVEWLIEHDCTPQDAPAFDEREEFIRQRAASIAAELESLPEPELVDGESDPLNS